MIKDNFILLLLLLISLSYINAQDYYLDKNIYPREYDNFVFLGKDFNEYEVLFYKNGKISNSVIYKKIDNPGKNYFVSIKKEGFSEYKSFELSYEKNKAFFYGYGINNKLIAKTTFFFDNNKKYIKGIYNFKSPVDNSDSNNKFGEVLHEYKFNEKGQIIYIKFSNFYEKWYFYSNDKIKEVKYHFLNNNQNESINKYVYKNDTDYICTPCDEIPYEFSFSEKKHFERSINEINIIYDEYYVDNKLYHIIVEKWYKGKLIEKIDSRNLELNKNELSKSKFKYRNFYSPVIKIINPSVLNLKLLETPQLNSSLIRLLDKNDELELLERGKIEIVNGIKGYWIKLLTIKGEIGWAFDAYLEEVK